MNVQEIIATRTLPYAGTVIAKVGQKVKPNDVVAEMNFYPGLVLRLKVSEHLAIAARELRSVIQVNVGELVEKGQILAFDSKWHQPQIMVAPEPGIIGMVSKTLGIVYLRRLTEFNPNPFEVHNIAEEFGISEEDAANTIIVSRNQKVVPGQILAQQQWKKDEFRLKYVASSMFGSIHKIDKHKIWIKSREISRKLYAYLSGEVVSVEPYWSVTIKSRAYKLNGTYGIGGERFGTISIIDTEYLKEDDIGARYKDNILIVKGKISKEALDKAARIGIPAIVAASCDLSVLRKYAGEGFIPGITGAEEVKTSVILMNNFCSTETMGDEFEFFKEREGKYMSVNGSTHIRAGAIRPQVLVFPDEGDA